MINAEELMVGDWVYGRTDPYDPDESKKKYPVRVIRIDIDGDAYTMGDTPFEGPDEWWDLEPIPVTPEILEKNGFKQDPRSRSRKSHQIINNDVYISWWKGRINILHKPFVGHSTNHINCDVKYVHELQHVLRMAGIEKKIIL